ncbi:hypothetical protein M527_28755 [Sphingobium indicum IP26]|uniref:Uncharacterized protein n=2 Tax=Sphingomonadaceae TaxID=41297 RepID=A0A8E1C1D4_9SPHN|nr:hypothetical protein M527_28755 [Sphingobium indicum IP26]EQB07564.1 hypothetical protein L286_03530 [Sphingobium sp. HDIP04]KER34853.1 hypothetical protein AL00_19220 [Sphingobium indicum F2]
MIFDYRGEKIGFGEPLINNVVHIDFEVISTCRCCGTEIEKTEERMGFETNLPFEDIRQWLGTTGAITRIMDLVQVEVKRAGAVRDDSEGGDA